MHADADADADALNWCWRHLGMDFPYSGDDIARYRNNLKKRSNTK